MQSRSIPTGSLTPAPPRPKRRRRLVRLAVVVAVLGILYAVHPRLLTFAGHWLDVGEPLVTPVDGVMVLGGEANTRPFLAAAIYRAGFARSVLVPEGIAPPAESEDALPAEHQVVRQVLLLRGVPMDSIHELDGPVDSTRDEAMALGRYLKKHPIERIAVVTSNFHTRRAGAIFRELAPDLTILVVAAQDKDFTADGWWHGRQGQKTFLMEWEKTIANGMGL